MSTPTPTLPSGWTLSADGLTATAPDNSTATGDVLTYVSQATQQISADATNIANAQSEIATLQSQHTSDAASIATLQAQVTQLQQELAAASGGNATQAALDALTAEVKADEAEIATLTTTAHTTEATEATISADHDELAKHEAAETTLDATLASDLTKLASDL